MRTPRLFGLGLIVALLLACTQAFAIDDCKATAIYDASTNGSTVLITGQSTRSVYICGYTIFAGGTASVSLVRGTGTTCATGETKLTPAYNLTAQTQVNDTAATWRGMQAGISQDVCIKTTAGVAVQAILFYSQE